MAVLMTWPKILYLLCGYSNGRMRPCDATDVTSLTTWPVTWLAAGALFDYSMTRLLRPHTVSGWPIVATASPHNTIVKTYIPFSGSVFIQWRPIGPLFIIDDLRWRWWRDDDGLHCDVIYYRSRYSTWYCQYIVTGMPILTAFCWRLSMAIVVWWLRSVKVIRYYRKVLIPDWPCLMTEGGLAYIRYSDLVSDDLNYGSYLWLLFWLLPAVFSINLFVLLTYYSGVLMCCQLNDVMTIEQWWWPVFWYTVTVLYSVMK